MIGAMVENGEVNRRRGDVKLIWKWRRICYLLSLHWQKNNPQATSLASSDSNDHLKQAVRVATQYASAPLLPVGAQALARRRADAT